jgi:hypothetical protein
MSPFWLLFWLAVIAELAALAVVLWVMAVRSLL